jgi:glycerol-3-phosphate acyltransferase PlsY
VSTLLAAFIALIPFYLLGAFPTGVLIARLHGIDITSQGSGNVGATNVSRVIGKKAGVLTLVGDLCKGSLAVLIASAVSPFGWFPAGAAVAVVCGHCFSVPPYLKGGKGVATALGAILVLFPLSALVALATFGSVFAFSKIVSLASISAALVTPIFSLITNQPDITSAALAIMAGIIAHRHRDNIKRLIEGREPKFSSKRQ